jgi:phage gpG-like protein
MEINYTTLSFPEVKDKISGSQFQLLKANVATLMMGQRLDTFEAQASVDGPWAPIKDVESKLIKKRKDFAKEWGDLKSGAIDKLSKKAQNMLKKNKILVDTGILRASFTGNSTGVEITEEEITIFTNVEYAARMNFGWKGQTPPRRFDEFTPEQEGDISRMIQDYLDGE